MGLNWELRVNTRIKGTHIFMRIQRIRLRELKKSKYDKDISKDQKIYVPFPAGMTAFVPYLKKGGDDGRHDYGLEAEYQINGDKRY